MFILLDDAQTAEVLSGNAHAEHELRPVEVGLGVFILPSSALEAGHSAVDALAALPQVSDTGVLDALKVAAFRSIAAERWQRSQTFSYDGVVDAYANPAIAAVTAAVLREQTNPTSTSRAWKLSPAVWRDWDAAELQTYGEAIDVHIQACFAREAELAAQIETATQNELLGLDLTAGWPN